MSSLQKELVAVNKAKLIEAENRFLALYPGGMKDPQLLEIGKKHKVEKMIKLTQESFAADRFSNSDEVVESMSKIAGQSSLVSVFEKPKFRDLVKALNSEERAWLAQGLGEFLHGDQRAGFEAMVDLLGEYKLAKWPLLTVFGVYYNPGVEVLVKPTTAKGVIEHFELELKYSPRPSYEFYAGYREAKDGGRKGNLPDISFDFLGYHFDQDKLGANKEGHPSVFCQL